MIYPTDPSRQMTLILQDTNKSAPFNDHLTLKRAAPHLSICLFLEDKEPKIHWTKQIRTFLARIYRTLCTPKAYRSDLKYNCRLACEHCRVLPHLFEFKEKDKNAGRRTSSGSETRAAKSQLQFNDRHQACAKSYQLPYPEEDQRCSKILNSMGGYVMLKWETWSSGVVWHISLIWLAVRVAANSVLAGRI